MYERLRAEVPWVNRDAPRDECFMAAPGAPRTYSYGNNNERRRALHAYAAVDMHPAVLELMEKLNRDYGTAYNVCVLNYYKDRHQHLGWHADDSPEQDPAHPIAVIAFGAARYLYVKEREAKGKVPSDNMYEMVPGALFIMPGGVPADPPPPHSQARPRVRGAGLPDLPQAGSGLSRGRKPFMHIPWPSIEQFHNVRRTFKALNPEGPHSILYRAKVKLHGTNAAVHVTPEGELLCQSRERLVTPRMTTTGSPAGYTPTRPSGSRLYAPARWRTGSGRVRG